MQSANWNRRSGAPGDLLRDGGVLNHDQDSRTGEVTRLIERWVDLVENGDSVSVEELCKDQPQLIGEVERELNAMRKMDGLLDSVSTRAGESSVPPVQLGQRQGLAEAKSSYQLQRLHAHGGCSEVYIAEDEQLGRTVAVKFLRPDVQQHESYRLRLEREAEITSRLDHPGVVSIHSRGEDEKGLPFYTMRFVEGRSLREAIDDFHLRTERDFNGTEFRKLLGHFVDACQTIAFAHARDVIHRDLKPDNIVTGNFGETYVIDWGLARKISAAGSDSNEAAISDPAGHADADQTNPGGGDLTAVGNVIGTPAFMSPEQARGEKADQSSDIFCLGSTLYTVLTGEAPYRSDSLVEVLRNARSCTFEDPVLATPGVPRRLAAICKKAMSAGAGERYPSPASIAAEVENYFADQPVEAYADGVLDRAGRWLRKNKTFVTAAVWACLVGLLILGIAAIYLIDANQSLRVSEAEANFQKNETARALEQVQERLYSQRIALAHSELQKNNIERAARLLEECPESQRQWEWFHLKWLIDRSSPFQTLKPGMSAFDPSGKRLFIAEPGGEVSIYETDAWSIVDTWIFDGTISDIEFSPDGRHVAIVGRFREEGRFRGVVRVFDAATGEQQLWRMGHGSRATCVAWSADSKLLITGGNGGRIRVRDASSLEPVVRMDTESGEVAGVAFFGDASGRFAACFASGELKCWEDDGSGAYSGMAHRGGATGISIHDGVVITCGNDRLARYHSLESVQVAQVETDVLVGHRDHVESVCFSNDGNLIATVSLDRSVRLWDSKTGEEISVINRHTSHVRHVEFDPLGRFFITSGDDRTTYVWEIDKLAQRLPPGEFVSFSHDGSHLISATRNGIYVHDRATGANIVRLEEHGSDIFELSAATSQEMFASVHEDGSVNIWNLLNGQLILAIDSPGAAAYSAFFLDDRTIAVGYRDATIRMHDVASGNEVASIDSGNSVLCMVGNTVSKRAVAGLSNGDVAVIDLEQSRLTHRFCAHDAFVLDIALSPDSTTIATTSTDGNIRLWDFETGGQLRTSHVGVSWLNCISFTPDGKRLVSGSEHTVAFWDAETLEEVMSMSIERCIHSMDFSPDGASLVVGGEDPRIRIWNGGAGSAQPD
ncbi:MAG: serine/threonine-protein kinase [Planctomycetota bacterium]